MLALAAPPDEDVALLADLLSLPESGRHPLPNLSPQRKKEMTLEALIRQLESLARRQPVVMVFEDAHWIDPTSRELLDLTVERVRSLPVLLIVTFRPEFQTPWTGQPQVTMLALNRLDRRDRTALVEQIAGGKALPDEVVAQIVDRTDGVPLFVEELTKSVIESGMLVCGRSLRRYWIAIAADDTRRACTTRSSPGLTTSGRSGGWRRSGPQSDAISYELLRTVSRHPEDELQDALARLVASELVFQRGTPPDAVYSFKHALVQDAAHGTLLRSARQQLHAQIAEALLTTAGEKPAAAPEIIAHHLQSADRSVEAAAYWREAGEHAVRRAANREAIEHLRRALSGLHKQPETSARWHAELAVFVATRSCLNERARACGPGGRRSGRAGCGSRASA